MGQTVIEIVLGALIAIVITILVEWLRKPRLRIEMLNPTDIDYPENKPARKVRFLCLSLYNAPLRYLLKFMMRNTALQCHGTVRFHHLDGQKIFDREMEIRWSDKGEPTPSILIMEEKQYPILNNFSFVTRVDICPGEHEKFDIAAKFDNEDECYGWSNETYFKGWRNPDWKLNSGRYLVLVSIISSGEKLVRLFRLINDVPQKDFRLEKALPEDQQNMSKW